MKHFRKFTSYLFLVASTLVLLAGCGGGGTGLADGDDSPDPGTIDIPIAYITRPTPAPDTNNNNTVSYTDLNDPIAMTPGARLIVRPRSSNRSDEIDITPKIRSIIAAELGVSGNILSIDIKGLDVAYDGSQLIFSVRAIPDLANNNNPELYTWNLWIYDFDTDTAAYVMDSALIRDEGADTGGGQDMDPHFLTDDRIVFSSSRNAALQERQLNEGRGQRYSPVAIDNPNSQAINLHIYDPVLKTITQISTNQTAELEPSVLQSGEIVFSRRGVGGAYSLFQINPTGLLSSSLYGANSSPILVNEESVTGATGPLHFLQPRELPDGRLMALMMPGPSQTLGGDIALIDAQGFIDVFTPSGNYTGGSRGQIPLTDTEINALDDLSPGGKFLAAYPLRDGSNRILVSWSPCQIRNGSGTIKPCSIAKNSDRINGVLVPASPAFGLWMYDPRDQTQQPIVNGSAGTVISEVIAAEPHSYPGTPDDSAFYDASLAAQNQGLIIIDSIYNEDNGLVNYAPLGIAAYSQPGTPEYTARPARFMRVMQPVPRPNNNVLPNLPNSGGIFGLLEILGYVPVEPDGSVTVIVPANTPLMLNTLMDNGRRISARHNQLLQVAPGEILRCVGCHDPNSNVPHGRIDSLPTSQNPGAVPVVGTPTGLGFTFADPTLYANALGETMADVYDWHNPFGSPADRVRDLQLQITYSDEWTDTSLSTPDPNIDLTYDPTWALPPAYPLIVPNLDPSLQGRIVIHYGDHIQPIWERQRTITLGGSQVLAPDGSPATSCVSCHTSNGNTQVPAGQLDLTGAPSGNGVFTVSYEEMTNGDNEQWQLTGGGIADRTRLCDRLDSMGNPVLDSLGNPIIDIITFPVPAPVSRGSALTSAAFFRCFEGTDPDQCGRFVQDLSPPPANCTDNGGSVSSGGNLTTKNIPATFTDAENLMAAKPVPSSLLNANELLDLLQTNCQSCHDDTASSSASAFPHSDDNNDTAYNALKPYINLVNPAASTFVFRLQVQNHQCWTSNCDNDAAEMLAAITSFSDAVPATPVTIPGGMTVTASFDHQGLLSPSELRLLSEWLDIGSPFYNNPFDSRL